MSSWIKKERIGGMGRIRKLEIENFRGVRALEWHPSPGFNCLVGPGDAGKPAVLDAIDLCLGAQRNPQFTDFDFHGLDCDRPVAIRATMGDLPPDFQSFEAHGHHLRGYDPLLRSVEDEPGNGLDTVITVELRMGDELEPRWSVVSSGPCASTRPLPKGTFGSETGRRRNPGHGRARLLRSSTRTKDCGGYVDARLAEEIVSRGPQRPPTLKVSCERSLELLSFKDQRPSGSGLRKDWMRSASWNSFAPR